MKKIVAPWNKEAWANYAHWRKQREELWNSERARLSKKWEEDFPEYDQLEPEAKDIKEAKRQMTENQPLARVRLKGLTVGDFVFASKAAQIRKEQC